MNIFESVKAAVTTRRVAEHYGIEVNHHGMARCPFHDDRTPSMKLDTRYHCFGCGADGDVIDFTAKLFRRGSYDAAEKLAADFGIGVDHHDPPPNVAPIRAQCNQMAWLLHAADVLIAYERLLKTGENDMLRPTAAVSSILCMWNRCGSWIESHYLWIWRSAQTRRSAALYI